MANRADCDMSNALLMSVLLSMILIRALLKVSEIGLAVFTNVLINIAHRKCSHVKKTQDTPTQSVI